jgi:uncharacterized protein YdeI (YjbR/CyaY-like superfamily)
VDLGAIKPRFFRTASDLRAWLEKNHATADAVWVGYYRKGTGKTSITYPESVDQALCYGWIDGIAYRIDDELHTNRFTPRRKGSYWSAVNIRKVQELQAAGLMTDAGLRAFEMRTQSAARRYSYENRPADLPAQMLRQLKANAVAARYWAAQSPSYRRTVAFWVTSAKKEETRQRRLETLIADSAAGRPVKPFGYGRDRLRRDASDSGG